MSDHEEAQTLRGIDWLSLDMRSGAGRSLRAPLFKAIGLKRGRRPRVLDATAGYGTDTWLLAAAGCEVVAIERVDAVFEALRRSHDAARIVEPDIAGRITLVYGDAREVLGEHVGVDVVYLDPMFAANRKVKPKRAMVELAAVVGDDADADQLLDAALGVASRRVVVKRVRGAKPLGNVEPNVRYDGRGFRLDMYLAKE